MGTTYTRSTHSHRAHGYGPCGIRAVATFDTCSYEGDGDRSRLTIQLLAQGMTAQDMTVHLVHGACVEIGITGGWEAEAIGNALIALGEQIRNHRATLHVRAQIAAVVEATDA